jgi:hypothetical protein
VIFPDVKGSVGVLDSDHQPVGERKPCLFKWGVRDKGWLVEIREPVTLDLSGLGEVHYVATYGDNGEMMFTLPLVGRPTRGGTLTLGL